MHSYLMYQTLNIIFSVVSVVGYVNREGIKAQHFPSNLYPYPDHNHQQRPMPTHACPPIAWHVPTRAHPCPPMLFKLRPCIQKLCNVYYPHTPSLGWIGQIKGCSLSLAWARRASWLAYSLHLKSLTPIWSWMQGCTKPMPTHAHLWTITSHTCPPKTHGHGHGHGYGHPM
jgi:hypothetical protein